MPAPAVAAGLVWRHRRRLGPWLAAAAAALGVLGLMLVMAVGGAMFGVQPPEVGGNAPSAFARADIPPLYLRLYQQTGARDDLDPWVLAGIGKVETNHGRLDAPGVRSGVNAYGCCAGPMQFMVTPRPSTWDAYGEGGDVYDPADAIPAAARLLRANGAPADYRRAIFAYNHASWYVADVLAWAERYRGRPTSGSQVGQADVAEVLRSPGVVLTPLQQTDLRSGGIDPRVLATLAWLGRRHVIVVTSLRMDHYPGTNHEAGRAFDVGVVDGQTCRENWLVPSRASACSRVALELAAVEGELRSTELIWCFDPDGPGDPRGFARADHCDHIHVGYDG